MRQPFVTSNDCLRKRLLGAFWVTWVNSACFLRSDKR